MFTKSNIITETRNGYMINPSHNRFFKQELKTHILKQEWKRKNILIKRLIWKRIKEANRKYLFNSLKEKCGLVWMKVSVQGDEDREMTVGAVLWGITCTVKGKRTRLWRSWTGKKPEGACGLVGYGLFSTFLCSSQHNNREQQRFYTLAWEALTPCFKDNTNL